MLSASHPQMLLSHPVCLPFPLLLHVSPLVIHSYPPSSSCPVLSSMKAATKSRSFPPHPPLSNMLMYQYRRLD